MNLGMRIRGPHEELPGTMGCKSGFPVDLQMTEPPYKGKFNLFLASSILQKLRSWCSAKTLGT